MSEMADDATRKCRRDRRRGKRKKSLIKTKIRAKMPQEYLRVDAVFVCDSVYDISIEPRVLSSKRISMIVNRDEAILPNDMTLIQGVDTPPYASF